MVVFLFKGILLEVSEIDSVRINTQFLVSIYSNLPRNRLIFCESALPERFKAGDQEATLDLLIQKLSLSAPQGSGDENFGPQKELTDQKVYPH